MLRLNNRVFATTLLLSGVIYYLFFCINEYFFSYFQVDSHVSIIFLPAGVRLLAVLIGGLPAALGVMSASLAIELGFRADLWHPSASLSFRALLVAAASGVAPWLIIKGFEMAGYLHAGLRGLTARRLTSLTFLVAFGTSAAHQILFFFFSYPASVGLWVQMLVGDVLGAFVCLWLVRELVTRLAFFKPTGQV